MIRSVLIADDEPNAREYLARLIGKRADLKLLGALSNGQEVINYCKTLMPDILILDIEMPGLNGLDVARTLTRNPVNSVIIFSTAFDQYAIEAFDVAAIGYLLKPFSESQLQSSIDRGIEQLNTQDRAKFSEKIQQVWEKLEQPPNTDLHEIEIKEKGLIRRIKVEDLLLLEADSEYVKLKTLRYTYLHRVALSILEQQLPAQFHRIHRSIIINTRFVVSHKYLGNSCFEFTLTNQIKVTSSRSYRQSINDWLVA